MTDYRPSRLNLLAFLSVLILTSGFLLWQLFVHSDYNRAPIDLKALMHRPSKIGEINNNVSAANVTCSPECSFIIGEKIIPARLANDAAGQLRQLNLRFVDTERGLIGYDNASDNNPEFYVLSFDKELIQTIQMDLNRKRRLEFTGYYPASSLIGFHSSDGSNWLYSAVSPSLKRL